MFFHLILMFAFALGLLAAPHAFAANAAAFDGVWALIGVNSINDQSTSTVAFDYADKFGGSFSSPGFEFTGSYKLKAAETTYLPSFRLLYAVSTGSMNYGFSVGLRQHPKRKITSEKFDFATPPMFYDRPHGYQTTTELQASQDVDVAFEPGYGIGPNSMLFLKVAYHQMSARVTSRTSVQYGLVYPEITEVAENATFSGIGVGGGFRYTYSDKIFIEALYETVHFADEKVSGPSIVSSPDEIAISQTQTLSLNWSLLALSLGYRF